MKPEGGFPLATARALLGEGPPLVDGSSVQP
ncbi:hypothetical protein FHS02_001342 [Massilia umbonata]|uniref:Uncharacterized protein n=1 Tax=Pseudoduganella umbonata TaxID=864828 RepID=A0A7W5HBH2_9BURK|nr:hypothetical protein [Pseudoduganella umbonata]